MSAEAIRQARDDKGQKSGRNTALRVRALTRRFGGLVAVNNFDLEVAPGELIGLIGPNGAGKTTVFNLLSGVIKPNLGQVEFEGEDITGQPSHLISSKGLIRTFQQVRLMSGMTVAENLKPAFHDRLSYSLIGAIMHSPGFLRQESFVEQKIDEVLGLLNIERHRDTVVNDLPYGIQRKVGIARSLCREPKMLLLDEPTAGLNPRETDDIVGLVRRVWDELHISIIIVEHNMRVIMNMSQRIVVMNKGTVLAEGSPQQIQSDEQVIRIYLGEKSRRLQSERGGPDLAVEH